MTAGGICTNYAGAAHSSVYEISAANHIVIDASRKCLGNRTNPAPLPGHLEFSADGRSASGWNCDLFDGQHTTPKPHFKGYFYTRPAIYECEAESAELPTDGDKMKCNSIRFITPLSYMINFKVNDYVAMQKPERKKQYGIQYDENDISGDTDYNE